MSLGLGKETGTRKRQLKLWKPRGQLKKTNAVKKEPQGPPTFRGQEEKGDP